MDKENFIYWLKHKDNDLRLNNTTINKDVLLNSNFKLIEHMFQPVLDCLKENKLQTKDFNLFYIQFAYYVYCNSTK